MQQGDQVRIGTGGVSVFTIVSVDEDAHSAIIESAADAPGEVPVSGEAGQSCAGYLTALPDPCRGWILIEPFLVEASVGSRALS